MLQLTAHDSSNLTVLGGPRKEVCGMHSSLSIVIPYNCHFVFVALKLAMRSNMGFSKADLAVNPYGVSHLFSDISLCIYDRTKWKTDFPFAQPYLRHLPAINSWMSHPAVNSLPSKWWSSWDAIARLSFLPYGGCESRRTPDLERRLEKARWIMISPLSLNSYFLSPSNINSVHWTTDFNSNSLA